MTLLDCCITVHLSLRAEALSLWLASSLTLRSESCKRVRYLKRGRKGRREEEEGEGGKERVREGMQEEEEEGELGREGVGEGVCISGRGGPTSWRT